MKFIVFQSVCMALNYGVWLAAGWGFESEINRYVFLGCAAMATIETHLYIIKKKIGGEWED